MIRKIPGIFLRKANWLLAAASLIAVSCSTTRLLDDGSYRLASNKIVVTNDKRFGTKEIQNYIKQKPNSYLILGWNPFLNLYNWSGRNESKGINKFIRKIGTPPVVYAPSLVDESIDNVRKHLEYLGYYNSLVESEVSVSGRKVDVTYTVTLGKRFRIGNITYSVPEGEFRQDFRADTANISVKPGDFLSEDALEKETERSARYFRNNGYFGFTKNFYSFVADTLSGRDTADLEMIVNEYTRNETPDDARPLRKFHVGTVTLSHDLDLKFNERTLRNMNTIRPGALYDERDVNNTYARLTALRMFSGVNVEMSPRDSGIVDCTINLSQSRMQGFKVNLETSTNSSGLIGISPQISYFHKNIFRGGQWLNLSFLGNFQFKYYDRRVRSNELGTSVSISFPEFLGLPNSLFKGPSVPRTEIAASYNYQQRPEYTRNMVSTSFGYSGSFKNRFFYQIYPLQLKIVRLFDLDPSFYKIISDNPFMRDAYQNHFDAGSGFMAYYTTSADVNPRTSYRYVRLQFDLSGNVMSLFNQSMKQDAYGARLVWGTPYSQYVRSELTLGNTFVFGRNNNQALAIRLLGGFGHAYGNSSAIPFEKQFYSGGANSMRGWQARDLGPGRSPQDTTFVIPSQAGDMKLEVNLEYRFPLFWKFNGALFTDVGNIWTLHRKEEDPDRSQFSFRSFGESVAANWGTGLRLDLTFLILRLDMGMKFHDPSREVSWIRPRDWLRRGNYAIHFGVGYPF
jgi:outer membrane protein assembly factor BamA